MLEGLKDRVIYKLEIYIFIKVKEIEVIFFNYSYNGIFGVI